MTFTIENYLQVISIAVVSLGFVLATVQVGLLKKQIKNQYDWNTRIEALQFSLVHNPRLYEARIKMDKTFGVIAERKTSIPIDEIEAAIKNDSSIHTEILYILAHLENMALAIHAKTANNVVAYEMVAGMTISFVRVFREFIEHRKDHNDKAYNYLLKLDHDWREKRRINERPKFEDLRNIGGD